jgi:hypothetical protein
VLLCSLRQLAWPHNEHHASAGQRARLANAETFVLQRLDHILLELLFGDSVQRRRDLQEGLPLTLEWHLDDVIPVIATAPGTERDGRRAIGRVAKVVTLLHRQQPVANLPVETFATSAVIAHFVLAAGTGGSAPAWWKILAVCHGRRRG